MKIRNFKIKAQEKALNLVLAIVIILSLSTLVSCSSDEEEIKGAGEANLNIMLTIQTRASSSSEYSEWENYIDINSHNFRIYFFTADKDDVNQKNTLITSIYASATDITEVDEGKYTVIGTVTDVMTAYTNFKVVVLANWGSYPSVTEGVTTIDDLVEGDNTTFNASYYLSGINTSHYIPFFGVNEYTGVDWKLGTTITTNTTINMLSALAKVEVTFDESYIARFGSVENVEIVRYNSKGYSAPKGIYNNDDYVDTDGYPLLSSLHLVGGANDADEADGPKTYSFVKEETAANTNTESWLIYLPEYDNMSTDYSYIRVTLADGTSDHIIYFGEYEDGVCTAYDTDGTNDRFDIYRNYYYSFTVSHTATTETYYIELITPTWSNHFKNDSSTDLVKHD